MTRIIPSALAAHIAATESFLIKCLLLKAIDGSFAGFTENVDPLTFDLDLGDGPLEFAAGMQVSALTLAVGLDASFAEVNGPFDGPLTSEAVAGGRWDNAQAWLFEVSPDVPDEFAPLLSGKVAEAKVEGDAFVIELRNQAAALGQPQGRALTPYCDADLGDDRCGFALVGVAATVTAVTDALRFTVSFVGSFANDYFNLGKIEFVTGDLAGTAPVEIFDWSGTGAVTLFVPLHEAPQVGDTLTLKQGCAKTWQACRDFHGDAAPHRGFKSVPGTDQVQRATVPSA